MLNKYGELELHQTVTQVRVTPIGYSKLEFYQTVTASWSYIKHLWQIRVTKQTFTLEAFEPGPTLNGDTNIGRPSTSWRSSFSASATGNCDNDI